MRSDARWRLQHEPGEQRWGGDKRDNSAANQLKVTPANRTQLKPNCFCRAVWSSAGSLLVTF